MTPLTVATSNVSFGLEPDIKYLETLEFEKSLDEKMKLNW